MSQIETLSQPQAVSMADEWFQFATGDHFWMQWRHRVILRAIKRAGTPLRRALEIGCGNGVAREMLERDFGFPVDGCDLNRTALERAKPGKGRLFVYDILDQAPSLLGRYDAVFLLDVIEHVPDDAAFLIAASRHLLPGGLIIVNVPASMLFFSDYDRAAGHVRRYNTGSLAKLLVRCGVEVQAIWPWGLLMVPALLARKTLLRRAKSADVIRKGFVPPNRIFRGLLHSMKNIETALPFPMPFG
ncbi:MAG TPA: class I SAM-dependent methyltransferase, partial [Candidatus Udaeobacter sp.]|nr:class I SAM-dependent methyltransferase [Candidatus Udaeobacter sp.]